MKIKLLILFSTLLVLAVAMPSCRKCVRCIPYRTAADTVALNSPQSITLCNKQDQLAYDGIDSLYVDAFGKFVVFKCTETDVK